MVLVSAHRHFTVDKYRLTNSHFQLPTLMTLLSTAICFLHVQDPEFQKDNHDTNGVDVTRFDAHPAS